MRRRPLLAAPLLFALVAVSAACSKSSSDAAAGNPYPPDPIDGVAVTSTLHLAGLHEPVRVVRDHRGMVHIYARDLHDAGLAQGYVVAQDRGPQLEIFRRLSEGRLAEYAGNLDASLASQDLFFRALGLRRVAEKYYATLAEGSDAKVLLDAYAAGISARFAEIRDGGASVPNGWLAIPRKKYLPWDAAASLAIARLQTWSLSWNGDEELDNTVLFDAARTTFRADATDPAIAARAGFVQDVLRHEPPAKVPVLSTPPPPARLPLPSARASGAIVNPPRLTADALASARHAFDVARAATDRLLGVRGKLGSNNWVVAADHSVTGHPLVASDPHLALRAPAIFHMASLHVHGKDASKDLDVGGMAFAGIPGVVLGYNANIAWGATVSEFDVNDLYRDVVSADGHVNVGGKSVAVETVTETIDYGDGRPQPITLEFVPGHGVILPTIKGDRIVPRDPTKSTEVVSYRWTGLEPTGEFEAFVALARAKNVDEARAAMAPFQVGSQNFVFGDTSGNIAYTTHSWLPLRPKGAFTWDAAKKQGLLPCFVLPGDAGLEWSGKVDDAQLPQAKNPKEGYLSTANSDQYGLSFDDDLANDPVYLSCSWDPGFRQARIHERIDALLAAGTKLSLDDLAAIQADARSPLGARIAPYLVAAIGRAEDARSGKTPAPDLTAILADPRYSGDRMQTLGKLLQAWGAAGYDTPAAVDGNGATPATDADKAASEATVVFNATLVPLFGLVFDDEWKAMGSPRWGQDWPMKALLRMLDARSAGTKLATADASGESVLWDDLTTKTVVESKDERLLRALLDGLAFLDKTLGKDPTQWRWGALHTVRFDTLLTGTEGQLSIPASGDARFPAGGFPRHGDEHVVDASHYGLGGSAHVFSFSYGDGPAQRFVADMDPAGIHVRNALPGGNVWIPSDAHFDDEAQRWRVNQNAPIATATADVVAGAEARLDLVP